MEHVEIIYDRAAAIEKAISNAKPGDTIVIAGKGHETYQKFSDRTVHFDDVEQAKKALSKSALQSGALDTLVSGRIRMKTDWNRRALDHSRYVFGSAL